jgi:hypothetical protein
MRRNIFTTLYILLALCFSSCVVVNLTGANAVSGNGALDKFEMKVSEYNKVKIEGNCEIRYYAALSDTVTLEVQPNLREYFTVEVKNSELIVRSTKRIGYNSSKTPVLTVSTPTLNSLVLGGV